MRVLFVFLFTAFLTVPHAASAAGFSFLLETTYASSPVNSGGNDDGGDGGGNTGGTTGGGGGHGGVRDPGRRAEEFLSASSVSSAMSLSQVSAVSSEAPKVP